MAVDQTWWPTTAMVAALVNSRTATSGLDSSLGGASESFPEDFTTTSTPSKARVEVLIELAALEFRARSGHRDPCSLGLKRSAAGQVAFLAARLLEISYRTDGADDKKGAVNALRDLWNESADQLAAQIAAHCPPDPDGPDIQAPGSALRPRGTVRTWPPVMGLRTRW
jgi:hypothetical protein